MFINNKTKALALAASTSNPTYVYFPTDFTDVVIINGVQYGDDLWQRLEEGKALLAGVSTKLGNVPTDTNTALAGKQAALTSLESYDATKTQTLQNVEGVLTWVDESE